MKRLLRYLSAYKKETVLGPLFKLLEASFELLVPLVIASIIDVGIKNADKNHIWRMCLLLVALAVIGLVCAVTAQYFAAKAATGFSKKVRHALFGRPSTNDYNCVGSKMNPAQIDLVRHSFDLYKSFVRPMAGKDLIFHHTPEVNGTQPRGTCILERAAEDGSRSMIGVFNLCRAGEREQRIFPRGIAPNRRYRVTLDNSGTAAEVDGFTLRNEGIRVRLDGALQSELLLLEAL